MKLALCLGTGAARVDAERLVGRMLASQAHEPGCASRVLPCGAGYLGVLGRPGESPNDWLLWESERGDVLAFAGLPVRPNGSSGPAPARPDDPLVRDALRGDDPEAVVRQIAALDGAFVAVWWDAGRGSLTVVTDFLGMQPLYRAAAAGATLLASEMKALVGDGALAPEAHAGAWGAMLYFGHQIGAQTLLAGATRVPPACALTFEANGEERSASTWRWPASQGAADTPALRDAIGEAVRTDVAAYAAAYPNASILLSGGFDSRLILCLCRDLGLRPRAIVQSHPDENADADARFAEAFARTLALPTRRVAARPDFYSTVEYLHFLARNEVTTPSHHLFIPNVAAAVRGERDGVWEGLLLDPALKFDYGDGGFASYVETRNGGRRRAFEQAARLVFTPAWVDQMGAEYDAMLAAEGARYSDDADGVWRFSVLNRSRYRTGVNPYQVYDTVTPPLTPGMSKRFWELVATADARARFGKQLYRGVFDRLAPDGLRVPLASGASLVPGRGGMTLYHTQRARAAVQRLARRGRVTRALRSAGLPTTFTWQPSRFLMDALAEVSLDDPRVNADWVRRRRGGGTPVPESADARALEVLMYWQAWRHVMQGTLLVKWGPRGTEKGVTG